MKKTDTKFEPTLNTKFSSLRKLIVLDQHVSISKLNIKSKDVYVGAASDLSDEYDDCVVLSLEVLDNSNMMVIYLI